VALPTKVLAPGEYFLVQLGPAPSTDAGSGVASLSNPDLVVASGVTLNPAGGQLALVRYGQPLACGTAAAACTPSLGADLVAYGTATEDAGTPAGALTATTSAMRKGNGCVDTAVNASDFDETAAPTPRNTKSTLAPCARTDSPDAGGSAAVMLLNEIKLGASAIAGSAWDYIEIMCTPKASLSGYYVAAVEAGGRSRVLLPLAPHTCGSNGLVYIKAVSGGDLPQETQSLMIPVLTVTAGATPPPAENVALMIVSSPAFIPQGTDFDFDDDGKIDLPSGASLVDGLTLGSGPVLAEVPRPDQPAGSQGASRLVGNKTAKSAAAWFAGALKGGPDSKEYDGSKLSAGAPAGALLTPGAANFQAQPPPLHPADAGDDAGDPPATAPASTAQTNAGPAPDPGPPHNASSVCTVLAPGSSPAGSGFGSVAGIGLAIAALLRRRRA
jgi:hypothetical protein